jgi:hypothetical protein
MPDSLAHLAPSMLAVALNLLLVVLAVPDKLATRTVARCVAFVALVQIAEIVEKVNFDRMAY